MNADERRSTMPARPRFRLRMALGVFTVVAVALGWSLSAWRLCGENDALQRRLALQERRLSDVEDLLTGRPFEYRTSGLVVTRSGEILPEQLAPREDGMAIPAGVDEAMLMDGVGGPPRR